MDYQAKYLKYKTKYLQLKSIQSGGNKNIVIHISGPSGAGKTTLGNKLKDKFGNKITVTDIDDLRQDFIRNFYGNKRWSIIKYLKLCYNIIIVNIMNEEVSKLKLEIEELKNKNNELEEKLKSYTNPTRNKKYYEKNSDIVKEKAKNYMEKIKESNPEKLKEWRHQAYLNRKAKLKLIEEDNK